MASCQILWKNLRKTLRINCGTTAKKLVEKENSAFSERHCWWKKKFDCGFLNEIHTIVAKVDEKSNQIKLPIKSTKSTIST